MENKIKIFYFNDTKEDQTIFIKSKFVPNYIMKPTEGKIFEFDSPKDTIPFIKIWDNNQVFISYMREPVAEND